MDKIHASFWQIIAYFVLLLAKGLIIKRILSSSSCAGISGKTQILYALVLTGRVLNTFGYYSSYWSIKYFLFYFGIVLWVLEIGVNVLIYRFYKTTYEKQYDNFKIWRILVPIILLTALVGNYEITWNFSIYLETVAIIPQIYFIKNSKHVEKYIFNYMCLLTIYKSIHVIEELINQAKHSNYDIVNLTTGLVQVMLLVDCLLRLVLEKREEAYANNVRAPVHSNLSTISENLNNSRFNDNLKDVVLSPSMLNEKDQKSDTSITPTVHEGKKVTFNVP